MAKPESGKQRKVIHGRTSKSKKLIDECPKSEVYIEEYDLSSLAFEMELDGQTSDCSILSCRA